MIRVNYPAMETAYEQIKSINAGVDSKLDDLKARLKKLEWEGDDRTAYQTHQDSWDAAVRDLNLVLADIGRAVAAARENYMQTEAGNAKLWG